LGKILSYSIATIVVASLSRHFCEALINRLKRFFPYRASREEAGWRPGETALVAQRGNE
jgi:hypothetical protein